MARLILGALVSIIMLIGGLSGQFVFRGTNSSLLLVVASGGYLIYDIYRIIKYCQNR